MSWVDVSYASPGDDSDNTNEYDYEFENLATATKIQFSQAEGVRLWHNQESAWYTGERGERLSAAFEQILEEQGRLRLQPQFMFRCDVTYSPIQSLVAKG